MLYIKYILIQNLSSLLLNNFRFILLIQLIKIHIYNLFISFHNFQT